MCAGLCWASWRTVSFPSPTLPVRRDVSHYATQYNTIEFNTIHSCKRRTASNENDLASKRWDVARGIEGDAPAEDGETERH
jgi:hypothetical protein